MSDVLSLEMRELVERARRDETPVSNALKRRIRGRVALAVPGTAVLGCHLAAAAGSASAATATVGSVTASSAPGFLAWVAGGFLLGASAIGSYTELTGSPTATSSRPPAAVASTRTKSVAPERTASVDAATPEQATRTRTSFTPAPLQTVEVRNTPCATDPRPAPSLAEEVQQLARVQQKLRAGQGQAALDAVDEAARRFPHGQLQPDLRAARVLALCQLGRLEEARNAADAFLRWHVASPLTERVRNSCAFTEIGQPLTSGRER